MLFVFLLVFRSPDTSSHWLVWNNVSLLLLIKRSRIHLRSHYASVVNKKKDKFIFFWDACFIEGNMYNHGQNNYRLFHVLTQCSFNTNELELNCHHQKVNVRVASRVVERLKTYDPVELCTWTTKNISATTQPMATNLGGWVVNYQEGLQHIKPHNLLITWSCEIKWQTKTVTSPLTQCLGPSNLAGWWLALWGCYPKSHMTL